VLERIPRILAGVRNKMEEVNKWTPNILPPSCIWASVKSLLYEANTFMVQQVAIEERDIDFLMALLD
jgi:hypothetical protein